MKFINLSLEDNQEQTEPVEPVNLEPNTTDQAIDAVNNKDSTEPEKVIQVANYKEELANIRAKRKEEDENDDFSSENNDDNDNTDPDNSDGSDNEDLENNDVNSEDGVDKNTEETSEDDDADITAESEEEKVATEGFKSTYTALESLLEMSKYHDLLERRSKIGGINQATSFIITNALKTNSERTGYKIINRVPSMEDFNGFTNSVISTKELKLAVEGFIENVWLAIKKFFKGIYEWIMSLLGLRKGNGQAVSKKEERTKREEAAIKAKEVLEEKLKKIDLTRERDEKRAKKIEEVEIAEGIARHLFASSDKGTFAELEQNSKNIGLAVTACIDFANAANALTTKIAEKVLRGGAEVPLQELCLERNVVGNLKITKTRDDNNVSNYIILSEELISGVGVEFVLSDKNTVRNAASPEAKLKALKDLGNQTFRVAKTKDGKASTKIHLPKLTQNDRTYLTGIIDSILVNNKKLTVLVEGIKSSAEGIEKIMNMGDPPSWQALKASGTSNVDAIISVLKAQVTLLGKIQANMAGQGLLSVDRLVNNFVDNFVRLAAEYN